MPLDASTPLLTAGTVNVTPLPFIRSLGAIDNTGGGAYSGTPEFSVRGVVAYTVPGADAVLVVYFDPRKCLVDTLSPGVTINSDIVDATAAKNQVQLSGTFVVLNKTYTYTAKAEVTAINGDTNQCVVTITASENL
ncbi:hypothetical protein B0H15DRAFT_934864 [Mycena belliarum]|uniref:Uncharacterized protein n=1 Tax=Mycena belliarum TaxID=1033014 RepID=A0AAD6TNK3_9AGAR|nr:hypothetical protein B0H15DRAFT_934864 [Mycena belliae]